MHYRIKFKAAPKEFVFETIKHSVLVKDVILTVRKNFKIHQDDLHVYSDEGMRLQPEDLCTSLCTSLCTLPVPRL